MKVKHLIRSLCAALCLCLLFSAAPAARAADKATAEADALSVLREGELEALVERFLADQRVDPEKISIGFIYTATGEEWYYRGDELYYSASLYKVPLMMLVSNMVARGELAQDDKINGRALTRYEEGILVHSSNNYAHSLMDYFWPDNRDCRALWPALADMEPEELPDSFYRYSLFSARFISRVMLRLYSEPESYPLVTDFLKQAQPERYFRHFLEGKLEIAQKYGAYEEVGHTTGILYTKNPVILTFLSRDTGRAEERAGELALLLTGYAETLDARLEAREKERARLAREAEEAQKRAEREAAEEAARRTAEAEEAARLAAEAAERAAELARQRRLAAWAGGGALALAAGALLWYRRRRAAKKRKNEE